MKTRDSLSQLKVVFNFVIRIVAVALIVLLIKFSWKASHCDNAPHIVWNLFWGINGGKVQ